ncbi:hypothetical protein GCM10022252_79290 [Streptosporangium oxazolinicum]|uniref:Uncharacterized protein n=1 Tax=Streptosporangium oxazolinicum TaxID=909287 RepID=A0ABP8BNA5_9ACTN
MTDRVVRAPVRVWSEGDALTVAVARLRQEEITAIGPRGRGPGGGAMDTTPPREHPQADR